jgi:protein-arginine kinase activator protein McsA
MVSFAVHLFIDAWPAGWMKSIMDVDRQPKKAYFAYRKALEPLMVSLRSDRDHFFAGEATAIETWICNDLNSVPNGYQIKYQIEKEGKVVFANQTAANIPANSTRFQGFLRWKTPPVTKRTEYIFRIALVNEKGESEYQNKFEFEVFPQPSYTKKQVFVLGKADGKAEQLTKQAKCKKALSPETADVILIDDFEKYTEVKDMVNKLIFNGKTAIFLELKASQYNIANTIAAVEKTSMGDYYFVSPETGHPLVRNFKQFDFRFWCDGKNGLIEPILPCTFSAREWDPILSSGATDWVSDKGTVMAAGELRYGKGVFRICEVELVDRMAFNPTALIFFNNLLNGY